MWQRDGTYLDKKARTSKKGWVGGKQTKPGYSAIVANSLIAYKYGCRFLLSVNNTWVGLTARGRHISFVKVAFGSHGSWFIAGDQLGVLYCFDLARNRWLMRPPLSILVIDTICYGQVSHGEATGPARDSTGLLFYSTQ